MSSKRKRKVIASKLFADFWIWDNFLRSGHHTLDTLPFYSQYFKVERLQTEDALYMCVFTKSQIYQQMAMVRIRSLFRQADRPEPVFLSMRQFKAKQLQPVLEPSE